MQVAKQQLSSLLDEPSDDDDDDDDDKKPPSRAQVITTAVCYLCAGAAVAFIFADPFVEAIGAFSKASGIPPFFISFIVTPLACSSSEAVSSLIFAKKKRKRTISMTYSQVRCTNFPSCHCDSSRGIVLMFFASLVQVVPSNEYARLGSMEV
jgi:Ca2+/H+ antiporter